jgi:hypothetical protein
LRVATVTALCDRVHELRAIKALFDPAIAR